MEMVLLQRKPAAWAVMHEGRDAIVAEAPKGGPRGKRWRLQERGGGVRFFSSRRKAFGYFEDRRGVKSKPVFDSKGQRLQ